MGNCRDCKHWQPLTAYERYGGTPGISEYNEFDTTGDKATDPHSHRICGLITLAVQHLDGPNVVPKAFTQDASTCKADLWTAADFGCVLHEPLVPALPNAFLGPPPTPSEPGHQS